LVSIFSRQAHQGLGHEDQVARDDHDAGVTVRHVQRRRLQAVVHAGAPAGDVRVAEKEHAPRRGQVRHGGAGAQAGSRGISIHAASVAGSPGK
jgi:hypothetical protein